MEDVIYVTTPNATLMAAAFCLVSFICKVKQNIVFAAVHGLFLSCPSNLTTKAKV